MSAMFISSKVLKQSVDRMLNADVSGSFFQYCILRRLMVTHADEEGLIDISGSVIKDVIDEAALIGHGNDMYFNPTNSKKAYLKPRWWSNGFSDTTKSWGREDVLERVNSSEHVTIRVKEFSAPNVQRLLKIKDARRVSIVDMASWWARNQDVSPIAAQSDDGLLNAGKLVEWFKNYLSINDAECDELFASTTEDELRAIVEMVDIEADPATYLPPYKGEAKDTKVVRTKTYGEDNFLQLIDAIDASGYMFTDAQIASFLTAVRTKPFVILAGVSGTGKTHLPITVAEATGSEIKVCPVKPDWTDSSDLLGYTDIRGAFHPGILLKYAKKAQAKPEKEFFFLLDEMNIARIEYYFADILSLIETMRDNPESGLLESAPLVDEDAGPDWADVRMPSNLCIVGSVNMDESTQPISKKVLDRAFVLDFNEVDLMATNEKSKGKNPKPWESSLWGSDRQELFGTCGLEEIDFGDVVLILNDINFTLKDGGFNFGYRMRNEICSFVANAKPIERFFSTPSVRSCALDIAIEAKILSRIEGNSAAVRGILSSLRESLLTDGEGYRHTEQESNLQRSLAKLSQMAALYDSTGYTSYWG